jgi:putative tricarboxylic transport membrane protein
MKNRDLVSSVVWITMGILFVVGSLQLGLMRRGIPGPGFLPFFSALALIICSLFVLVPALSQKGREKGSEDLFPEPGSLRKVLLALFALVAFGAALEYAGYFLSTFFFMFFVTWMMEPKGWRMFTVLALITAVTSYLLFVLLLEVQLPKGLLGF